MSSSTPNAEPTPLRANRPNCPRCNAPLQFARDEYVCFTCGYEYLLDDRELDLLREGRQPFRRAAVITGLPLTVGAIIGSAVALAGLIVIGVCRIRAHAAVETQSPGVKWRFSLIRSTAVALLLAVGGACGGDDAGVEELEARLAAEGLARLTVSSDAFGNGEEIPVRYTCDGEDVSPPLAIADVPSDALSMAVIVDDPDASRGTWVHWVEFNMPPRDELEEGVIGTEGKNSWGERGYRGPCPPSGVHRYFFKVYALDSELSLAGGADQETLLRAMQGRALAYGELVGRYQSR